ncbi:MAG: HAD family hydrolase [Haloferacaceae archaeon]
MCGVDAVSFDLDDTLAVTRRDRATLLREACEAVGAPVLSREAYLDAHADNLTAETRAATFAALLDERGVEGVDPAALAAAYRERVNDALVPVPGAAGLLADLRERYRVGLLTNGSVRAQRAKVERLGWTDAFDAVVVTGDLPAGKPDPRAFAAACDALGAAPERTVHVGDDPEADVGGACGAGLRAVHVLGGDDRPDPRAVAHVRRAALADDLPGILRAQDRDEGSGRETETGTGAETGTGTETDRG